jgi:hypothetical protein
MNAPTKTELIKIEPANIAEMLPVLWAGRGYADFDDFERLADTLMRKARWLENATEQIDEAIEKGRLTQKHIDFVEKATADDWLKSNCEVEEYERAWNHWNRDELYEKLKKPKCDHRGVWVSRVIKAEVVGLQVAGMLACCGSNSASEQTGEIPTTILIEEIRGARPSALALESTCREIRRLEKYIKYPPKFRKCAPFSQNMRRRGRIAILNAFIWRIRRVNSRKRLRAPNRR